MRRGPARVAVLLVLSALAGAGAASCRRRTSYPGAPVFLISIDTLRADHLAAWGGRGAATPAIDALAKDGILFENALSHVPLTLPSHATIFTGLLPFQNGVRDNLGYRLPDRTPTLARLLKSRGYATGGAVSSAVLDRSTGIGAGFDFWDDRLEASRAGEALGDVQRPGSETEKRLEAWIAGIGPDKPVLAFLHLYEPHAPYSPPEPFASRYRSAPYDGEIAAADDTVGRFIAFLHSKDLYDRSIVVLLSDHGEGLNDHGEAEHGIFLYREAIRVPLVVKLPGSTDRGRRVASPVGLVDVFPTVTQALAGTLPPGLAGLPLWPSTEAPASIPRRIYSETFFPRFHFGWSDLASLTSGDSHYIAGPRPQLYDWRADPQERRDLAGTRPPAFRSLAAALASMSRPMSPPGASDPETVRKLASLGYVGGSGARAESGSLGDPREGIRTIEALREAGRTLAAGNAAGGIDRLSEIVRQNPEMRDAREALGSALRGAGRRDEAFEAFLEVDRRWPGSSHVMLTLAELALERGQPDRASTFAAAADALGAPEAPAVLAAIALARMDTATARGHARRALERNPESRASWLLLARIELASGNAPAGLAALEKSEAARGGPLEDAAFLRGDALARLGRLADAREAFLAEMRTFPLNPHGYTGMAILEASEGRPAEADRVLREMLGRSRSPATLAAAAAAWELLGKPAEARRAREASRERPRDGREPTPRGR
ncbi:MAG: sulfatase-like hydrolase/transferase [Acidobacteriota bacterium]|nr:sulfatase-like hydrolase/transferase [Acidobacteriota bacterium]